MKVEDYGIIYTEGTEAVGKYLLGAAGVAAAGYGGYKLYNYLKKKNEKSTEKSKDINSNVSTSKTNDPEGEKIVDRLKVPRWFPLYYVIATRCLYPKLNFFRLKSNLESSIAITKGDKQLILKFIKWLEDNGYFHWEKDDEVFFGDGLKTDKEIYLYEKGRLVQNFTKERFNRVVDLYNKLYPKKK